MVPVSYVRDQIRNKCSVGAAAMDRAASLANQAGQANPIDGWPPQFTQWHFAPRARKGVALGRRR